MICESVNRLRDLFRGRPPLYDGRMKMTALVLVAILAALPVFGSTPEQDWNAAIADQNKDYAQTPHAMLKIQDAAYVGEGQTATLAGRKGDPASWRWQMDSKAQGPLRIAFHDGKLAVTRGGRPVEGIDKSIAVDRDVDVRGEPTQVGAGVNGWRVFVYNQKKSGGPGFPGASPITRSIRLSGCRRALSPMRNSRPGSFARHGEPTSSSSMAATRSSL